MKSLKKNLGVAHKTVVLPFIDLILGRTVSKKLTVFIVATIAFFKDDMMTSKEWTFIACIYMFGLLYLNHLEKMKK